jgi:S-adenosylmethionine hydrolase
MSDNRIITLLTDFGLQDVYVGVMKGVIAQINPQVQVIDLTHQIPPQNIAAGRFCLMNAYPYFPAETVHIAVVDPGVGSQRRGVAIDYSGGYLVGPDNGLLSGILSLSPAIAAVELTNPEFWYSPKPSSTFHGRDIFATVGAHLASGISLEQLGTPIAPDSLVQLPIPAYQLISQKIIGTIQYIDRFGNLVTNIPAVTVEGKNWFVKVGDLSIARGKTYSDCKKGEAIALIGSHGWIEIAVNNGNAQSYLQLHWGDRISIIV